MTQSIALTSFQPMKTIGTTKELPRNLIKAFSISFLSQISFIQAAFQRATHKNWIPICCNPTIIPSIWALKTRRNWFGKWGIWKWSCIWAACGGCGGRVWAVGCMWEVCGGCGGHGWAVGCMWWSWGAYGLCVVVVEVVCESWAVCGRCVVVVEAVGELWAICGGCAGCVMHVGCVWVVIGWQG